MELKRIRQNWRYQLQEVARAAEISPSVLSRIENNWIPLNEKHREKILMGFRKLNEEAGFQIETAFKASPPSKLTCD